MEISLGRRLYRFDCPEPHLLGEYALDMLDEEQRTSVAAHAAACEDCSAELRELRDYLATDPPIPEPIGERVRRVLASLVSPRPGLALSGIRGAGDLTTREFRAEDISITVGPGADRGSLVGLVTGVDAVGRAVRMRSGDNTLVAAVDGLGNFEFEALQPGTYSLELDLDDRLIVVETLHVD